MKKLDVMWKYVIFTYLFFWFMVVGVCGVLIMVFEASDELMRWIVSLCSWTPTIVLLLMMKKLTGLSIKDFYKKMFSEKLNWKVMILVTVLIVGVFILSAIGSAIFIGSRISLQFTFVPSLLVGNIFFTAIQGASGEESGWRGYLITELEKRYGFIKGNVFLGLIWAFWHAPLWFLSSNVSGINLLIYIIAFIIGLLAFSVIMGVMMKLSKNIFLAFWMHFLFNFVLTFFIGQDLGLLIGYAIIYPVIAFIIILIYRKNSQIFLKEKKL